MSSGMFLIRHAPPALPVVSFVLGYRTITFLVYTFLVSWPRISWVSWPFYHIVEYKISLFLDRIFRNCGPDLYSTHSHRAVWGMQATRSRFCFAAVRGTAFSKEQQQQKITTKLVAVRAATWIMIAETNSNKRGWHTDVVALYYTPL